MKRLKSLRIPGLSHLSIDRQIPLLLGGTLFISLLFSGMLATSQITRITETQAQNLGRVLAQQTASSARDLLVTGDRLSLNVMLGQLTQSGPIARATIYSIDNKRIASTESGDYDPKNSYALFSAPVNYQNVIAGQLRLEIDLERFERPSHQAFWLFLGLATLLGTTGTVVAWNYARNRQQLLSRSVRQLQGLCHGKRAYGSDVRDEVEQLAHQLEFLIIQDKESSLLAPAVSPRPAPVPASQEPPDHSPDHGLVLALRLSNLAKLHNSLNQAALIRLLEQRLPYITEAARLHNGKLDYSAEGNGYIRFSASHGMDQGIFTAICCARLIQKLITTQTEDEPTGLEIELGISTLSPDTPGGQHPSLSDSASSQALMLASLGRGQLLLDGQYTTKNLQTIQAELIETGFGSDISQVGTLPEQVQLLIDRQAQQISAM